MMKLWNAWGDDSVSAEIPLSALEIIRSTIGYGTPVQDLPLETHLERIPASRIPKHQLLITTPRERLDYSHGASTTEWIELRCGDLKQYVDGVAFPTNRNEVEEIIQFADANKILIIPYGGGTSLAGQLRPTISDQPVIALSVKSLNRLLTIDAPNRMALAEAGISGPDLEAGLNAKGFTCCYFPQSFEYSTLGGWVMTRATSLQSNRCHDIGDLFMGGELITPKGLMKLPPFPAGGVGPSLKHLVIGSEGRMGLLTNVMIKISPFPEYDPVFGFIFPDWNTAIAAVDAILAADLPLTLLKTAAPEETRIKLALAGADLTVLSASPAGKPIREQEASLCFVGLAGSRAAAEFSQKILFSLIKPANPVGLGKTRSYIWLKNRFQEPYLRNSLWKLGYVQDVFQVVSPRYQAVSVLSAIETEIKGSLGCIHEKVLVHSHIAYMGHSEAEINITIVFRQGSNAVETLSRWKTIKSAVSRVASKHKVLTGIRFGIGGDQTALLENDKGPLGVDLLRRIFNQTDPDSIMNPGKMI